jgi:hypothetical protein
MLVLRELGVLMRWLSSIVHDDEVENIVTVPRELGLYSTAPAHSPASGSAIPDGDPVRDGAILPNLLLPHTKPRYRTEDENTANTASKM